jgi:hypothetical protein
MVFLREVALEDGRIVLVGCGGHLAVAGIDDDNDDDEADGSLELLTSLFLINAGSWGGDTAAALISFSTLLFYLGNQQPLSIVLSLLCQPLNRNSLSG